MKNKSKETSIEPPSTRESVATSDNRIRELKDFAAIIIEMHAGLSITNTQQETHRSLLSINRKGKEADNGHGKRVNRTIENTDNHRLA